MRRTEGNFFSFLFFFVFLFVYFSSSFFFIISFYYYLFLGTNETKRYFKQQEVTLWRKAPAKMSKGLISTNIKYDKNGVEEGTTPGEADTTDETKDNE